MTDNADTPATPEGDAPVKQLTGRTFLCVVDETEEFAAALQFACKRATNSGGRVALIYVIEPTEFSHWMAVGERMLSLLSSKNAPGICLCFTFARVNCAKKLLN